jgi:hypothetical protein
MLDDKQVCKLNNVIELNASIPKIRDEFSSPEFYQCPLCPGHMDEDDFAWSTLLDAPICRGCTHDIHNGFVGWDERPTPEQYNHADTIERIEEITGRTFQQLKFQYMQDKILEWGGTVPEAYRDIAFMDMPDSLLRVSNIQLDREFLKLVEANRGEK